MKKTINMLGYASDIAGAVRGSSEGPVVMRKSSFLSVISPEVNLQWAAMVKPNIQSNMSKNQMVTEVCQDLGSHVAELVKDKKFFTVIGGDHSSAIGTWSGAAQALEEKGDIGLIWIDAHMDSHTPETSPTGNIHGMPLAALLGFGELTLTHLLSPKIKLKPEHVCMIGIRSFEEGEAELLKCLKVKIFFMEEVERRGMDAVMADALEIVTKGTIGYGVTIDVDSVDPKDAPGTGVAEENGIIADDLCHALLQVVKYPSLIGVEITEFDPKRDKDHITEKLIVRIMSAMILGKLI